MIIRPIAAGICAGDMQHYSGRNPYTTYPLVCGHEVCGVVTEVGAEVRGCRRDDLVVIEPVVGCGRCHPCRHGKPNCCMNFCLIGLHRPGGYAEWCVAPEANVHAIPPGLDPVTASFAEPLTIGLQACRRGEVAQGDYCLVLGAGPIGLAILEVARLRGARVVVTDINEERLAFARELGAETLPANDQFPDAVLAQTNQDGADVVIEATGDPKVVESTIHLVAFGGRVVIVGLVKKGIGVTFPGLDFTRKEVNLLGSRNSVNCFPEAIELLAGGKVKYPRVATKVPLWESVPVFARLHANPAALHKAVLVRD
ncbi:MAG TPA: zinc-binding dehydrogenase [Candidatus Saccharimonadales bacterium]|nr:zinc-binding dehydrogenase [Candidatus Saccharimonadales bacterium]